MQPNMDWTSTSQQDTELDEPSGSRKIKFWLHYRLLLWKSFVLRRRQPGFLVFELLLPLVLLCIVLAIRAISVPSIYPACHITASPLPSMGFFKHLQSVICSTNFTCTAYDYDRPPGAAFDLPPWLQGLASLASQSELRTIADLEGRLSAAADSDSPLAFVDDLMGTADALASAYSAGQTDQTTTNMTAALEVIKRLSIPICGTIPGQNDFLGLSELGANGNLPIGGTQDNSRSTFSQPVDARNVSSTNATACSALNDLFGVETLRPWTLRLRTLMQGHILYHPVTPLTQQIVRGANQTALMFERLKNVSKAWVDMEAEVLPYIFTNSPVAKQLQRLARACFLLPHKPAKITAACCRLDYFLANRTQIFPNKQCTKVCTKANPCRHWTDVIEPISSLSAAVDNILSTCINYDRFVGYANATAMEERAENLSASGQTVMMLYFDKTPASAADLSDLSSTLLSTRFRLPFSDVDKTYNFKVVDQYWTPAPRHRVDKKMKYFTSGFIDVQEQIERSYLSIVTGLGDADAAAPTRNGSSANDTLYSNPLLPVEMKFIPGTCFQKDKLLRVFSVNMPMIIVIIWICTAVFAVRAIVYEKECRLKEFTKVMGMGNLVHWLNWFTVSLVTMGAPALVAALMLKFGGIYPNGDFFLILCVFLAYLWALIPQAFLVSVFYTKANFGAVVAGLLYFVLFIPYAFFLLYDLNYIQYGVISLCPQVAFALSFNRLGDLEVTGQGAQWNNMWGMELTNESFTLGNCLVMLFVDGILALVCTVYLEAVLPSTYGVPRKWYFLFTPKFWKDVCGKCGCCQKDKDHGAGDLTRPSSSSTSFSSSPPKQMYDQFQEPPPDRYDAGVSIRGLTKTYRGGKQTAVDNLWVDFYAGQITSFLGHNGAGKTTTMSILSGIFPASGGDAFICGKSIRTEMTDIRTFLGLCPQHNVLYDHMTVAEHLRFYGAIKGLTKQEIEDETDAFLEQLELTDKADTLSMSLSGGQKRRLSLAAAFIGNSKVVFLDEPTAGVDPHSRRSIWQMILRFRAGRTIILTTHHMDEADVLGDRIVVISQGHLRASGTSLFLKSKLAKCYYLTVEKAQAPLKPSPEEIDRQLMTTLTGQLPGIQLITSNSTQWVLALPSVHAMDNGFSDFFAFLDAHREDFRTRFGFGQYGLTDTSLEEIFLMLAEDPSKMAPRVQLADGGLKGRLKVQRGRLRRRLGRHGEEDDQPAEEKSKEELTDENDDSVIYANATEDKKSSSGPNSDIDSDKSPSPQSDMLFVPSGEQSLTGVRLLGQQFKACIVKRLHFVQRSRRGWFLEMVLPALTVLILMVVTSGFQVANDQPNMPINPWLMADLGTTPKLVTFFATNVWSENFHARNWSNASQSAIADIRQVSQLYADHMLTKTGWSGGKCLPPNIYDFVPSRFAGCGAPFPPPSSSGEFSLTTAQLDAVQASVNRTCSCESDGTYLCDLAAVGGFEPPTWPLATTDILYNLTGYNISDYLLKTRYDFILKRYGGLEFVADRHPARIGAAHAFLTNQTRVIHVLNLTFADARINDLGLLIADILRLNLPPTHFARVWYYNKGYVASVAYLNLLHNLQLRMLLPQNIVKKAPSGANRDDFAILASTQPMSPGKTKSKSADMLQLYAMLIEMFKSVGSVLALSYVPSSFVVFLIRERCVGSKSLQFMSGLNRTIYWISTYIWDVCNFLVPMLIIILIFLAFNEEAYVGADSVGGFIALMLIYGICNIPLMYLFTFVFRVPSLAFVVLLAANLMIAVVTSITVFLLDMVTGEDPSVKPVNDVLKEVFLVFPQYTFTRGFYDMSLRYAVKSLGAGKYFNTELFSWDLLGGKITILLVEAVIFVGAVLLVEYKSATCRCGKRKGVDITAAASREDASMDPDVMEERQRVYRDEINEANDIIRVMGVTKRFPKKPTPAVDDLTFGVRSGECFGLLGVNGAGKTTTFNMLTTAIKPDRGDIWVNGFNLAIDAHQAQAEMGYCPQFDALHEHLTGYETLQFFARIRGFPEDEIKPIVDGLLDRMSLRPHANKRAVTYSGGNLRKLSTAVAILGNPRVLLLDEPTSGMDPGAKRYLWEVLKSLMRDNCSIVLTSHSMEECEALCNRVGIMVAGQFHCFGTVPHLKERFGEGYIVEVDVRVPAERVTAALYTTLGGEESVRLTEAVGQRLTYQTSMQVSLAALFRQLVAMRNAGELHTFAVRQASLDSVFINFVRQQMELQQQQDDDYGNSNEEII